MERHFLSSLSAFCFNLQELRLYHSAGRFTGFVLFLTGTVESSEKHREQAVKSAR